MESLAGLFNTVISRPSAIMIWSTPASSKIGLMERSIIISGYPRCVFPAHGAPIFHSLPVGQHVLGFACFVLKEQTRKSSIMAGHYTWFWE